MWRIVMMCFAVGCMPGTPDGVQDAPGLDSGFVAGPMDTDPAMSDSGMAGETDVPEDSSAPGDTSMPVDTSPPVDTSLPADTSPPVDTSLPPCVAGLSVGECPPDFTLSAVGGGTVSLSDFAGKRILVVGSSLWCPKCRATAQALDTWWESTAPSDLVLLNVVVENNSFGPASLADAEAWRDAFTLTWTVLADTDEAWVTAWGNVNSSLYVQHSYTIIGSDGRVGWRKDGNIPSTASEIITAVSLVP